jgi:isoquinoline 1-oxidoreductase alpha subunit
MKMSEVEIRVNGAIRSVDADAATPLLWVLRDGLGLTGTKYGCGIGVCGACTVHIDGIAVRSCQTTVASVESGAVTTIEGLAESSDHPVVIAWRDASVVQCGYCQAGQIMAAVALLEQTRGSPTAAETATAMSQVLCRCGTYQRISAAVEAAAEMMR